MKKVLATLVVLFAFANVSADLDFSDSKIWKQFTNVANRSLHVAKFQDGIYVNNYRYVIDSDSRSWICGSNKSVTCVDFDKFGNTWVVSDSSLICVNGADTVVYTAAKNGFPSGKIRTVYCNRANGRLSVGTDHGVGTSNVDASGKPTTWTNALSESIHQIVGDWAINSAKVYHFVSGSWIEYAQFETPIAGDLDVNGNFWLSFNRITTGTTSETGLAKFDGQSWTEYFVSTSDTSFFGRICIDKNNTLWFSAQDAGLGSVNLSTMTVDRIPVGTYVWQPAGQTAAISKDENGYVIFSGANGGVYAINPSAVRTPAVVRALPRGDYKVVGTFDLQGRKIVNNSFSSVAHSSGARLIAVRTARGVEYQKSLIAR